MNYYFKQGSDLQGELLLCIYYFMICWCATENPVDYGWCGKLIYLYYGVGSFYDKSLKNGKTVRTATKLSQWMRHGRSKKLLHGHAIIKSTLADCQARRVMCICQYFSQGFLATESSLKYHKLNIQVVWVLIKTWIVLKIETHKVYFVLTSVGKTLHTGKTNSHKRLEMEKCRRRYMNWYTE